MATTEAPREPPTESMQGVTDEDVLHRSQSAHYHARPQAIRFPGDLGEEQRTRVQQHFDSGGFEPVPVQVTARNRQGEALRVRSQWDGVQLHLDVHSTSAPVLPLRPALAATARYYREQRAKLAALLAVAIVVLGALAIGLMGTL